MTYEKGMRVVVTSMIRPRDADPSVQLGRMAIITEIEDTDEDGQWGTVRWEDNGDELGGTLLDRFEPVGGPW